MERLFELRWRVLRAPWGQPRGSERDDQEATAWHRVAVTGEGEFVAAARLQREPQPATGRIRYMAVAEKWRRRGIGSRLLAALEALALEEGMERITLLARDPFLDFYLCRGYIPVGPGPLLFDIIPHTRMEKRLVREGTGAGGGPPATL